MRLGPRLGAIWLAAASTALAVEPETIALEYSAPPDCPARAVFMGELGARTELARFSDQAPSRRFRVVIEPRETGFAGRLEIIGATGEQTLREIEGEQCKDVVSVLALTAALAVDPHASTVPSSELEIQPATPAPSAAPAPSAPVVPQPAFPFPPAPALIPPPTAAQRESTRSLRGALGAGAHVTTGPAPKLLIGPLVFGEIESRDAAAIWSPLLRLGLRAARTGLVTPSFDDAEFAWLAAKTELCPIRLELFEDAELRPCAFADLGLVNAEGKAGVVDRPRSATRFWSSVGVSTWIRIALGDGFFGGAGGGLESPLTRNAFVFQRPSREVVYEASPLAGHAEISVGYDLW